MIFIFILLPFFARAQELPGTSWSLNPALNFQEKAGAPKFSSANGFAATFVNGDLEVQMKGTKIEEARTAANMTLVEFTTLEKLYSARGNPYEGQITDTVECDKAYKPVTFTFKHEKEDRRALIGAANERYLFGACAKSQARFWASYFNFYDPSSKMVVEARVFTKMDKSGAKKHLEKITKELLVRKN